VQWYDSVFELIDMRSFSNLWFWIALAVVWSSASHWVLGVPFDMVTRARRHGGEAVADVEDLVRVNINRMIYIARVSGLWLMGFTTFSLTMLAVLGFVYGIEFCQAVFLISLPMSFVGLMRINAARRIAAEDCRGEALLRRLGRHRLATQIVGMIAIFVTAMWGMWQNMTTPALGG